MAATNFWPQTSSLQFSVACRVCTVTMSESEVPAVVPGIDSRPFLLKYYVLKRGWFDFGDSTLNFHHFWAPPYTSLGFHYGLCHCY